MANDSQQTIVRQNQTQNVRELLVAKGYLKYLDLYEFAIVVEVYKDLCIEGLTPDVVSRLKEVNQLIKERESPNTAIAAAEVIDCIPFIYEHKK